MFIILLSTAIILFIFKGDEIITVIAVAITPLFKYLNILFENKAIFFHIIAFETFLKQTNLTE